MKNHYIGGNCLKKEGTWIVCRFKKGLGKKEGVVFLKGGGVGGLITPMQTMILLHIKIV